MSGSPRAAAPESTPPAFAAVLVVAAHPDDETFGLGAVITTMIERCARVDLLCLTSGESSSLDVGSGEEDELATRRSEELHAAARELGLRRVEQRYYPDGALRTVPACLLAAEVREAVRGHDALLVFDDGGVTSHPDHQAATDAALEVADELGLPVIAWVVPRSIAEQLGDELAVDVVGRYDEEIDFRFPVDRSRQLRAIARHASQSEVNPVVWRRLELTGDTECLRYLRRPTEAAATFVPGPCCSTTPAGEVVVPRAILDEIVEDCRCSYPAEVCGLVAGNGETLLAVLPVPNIARPEPGRCGFLMDGQAQFRAMREIEDRGLDLAGIYHSHPNDAAVPSEGDIRLAAYPEAAHLIVSVVEPARPEVRAWHIEDGAATELSIRVVDP